MLLHRDRTHNTAILHGSLVFLDSGFRVDQAVMFKYGTYFNCCSAALRQRSTIRMGLSVIICERNFYDPLTELE
jgi:hypothetical protein